MHSILFLYFLLVPFFLAFSYRAKGGGISLGQNKTDLARTLFWAFPVGFVCSMISTVWGVNPACGALCGALAFAGSIIGHSSEQTAEIKAHYYMAIITTIMLTAILIPLAYFHPWFVVFIPFGTLSWFAYWGGYRMKRELTFFGVKWCVPGDTSWGEFFTGFAAFGIPLMLIGLAGL